MKIQKKLSPFTYVLEAERDLEPADQTIFHMRPLTFAEETELTNRISNGLDAGTNIVCILQAGLTKWENLKDDDGEVIEPRLKSQVGLGARHTTVDPKALDTFPAPVRLELANAITEHGRLDADDAKN